MKKVSIISPCYNGEKYLENFLNSVLSQDYKEIELIMINDGSTDSSLVILNNYKMMFEKKGYEYRIITQNNKGAAAAINQGLKIFTGEYLMWVDSDDILFPDNVKKKVEFLEKNMEYGFVIGEGLIVNEKDISNVKGVLKRTPPVGKDLLFEDLIMEKNVVFCPGVIMVRSNVLVNAIPERYIFESKQGQNWQLMLPISYISKCGYLQEPVFYCVEHGDSHSRQKRNFEQNIERLEGFKVLLYNTIKNIPTITDKEIQKWNRYVEVKYERQKLRLAYMNVDKHLANSCKKSLKNLHEYRYWRDSFVRVCLGACIRKLENICISLMKKIF